MALVKLSSQILTDEKSTLVQVMAWCHQATSHYLSQCWPSFLSPYGIIRPQWVNWKPFNRCSTNKPIIGSSNGLPSVWGQAIVWTNAIASSLSHPNLGWLYVFSSFPLPPPQWLLLLTSKPFKLHLRYLGQRKYRSGKMYWMTFWWPWPKVTAVTLINKDLLVCRIKWEPLNQSLQNLVAISLWSC